MNRILTTLLLLVVTSALAYYVSRHDNVTQLERLERELANLREQNRKLAEQNTELDRTIGALREDPRLAERRAREEGALVRPDELVFQFEQPAPPMEVKVVLKITRDALELAGRQVTFEELPVALARVRQEIAHASLQVHFAPEIGPIRRQRIVDIVDASPLAPAEYDG